MSEVKSVKLNSRQRLLLVVILLSAFTGIVIGALRSAGLGGSALLYIGVPTLIALAFVNSSDSKTVMESTLKAITFIILISGPLLQEGFVCMLMAAPILYIVGALVAWPFDHYRKKKENASKLNLYIMPFLLLIMSMEGVMDETTFDRHNVVEYSQVIEGSVSAVKSRLSGSRELQAQGSFFYRFFPRPEMINANGLSVGDRQWVDISYLKWVYWNEKRGSIQFEVAENKANYLRFKPVADDSYISSYLSWGETAVFMQAVSENTTRVTWRINFQREIDPAWYVQPLQQYMVGLVARAMVVSLQ